MTMDGDTSNEEPGFDEAVRDRFRATVSKLIEERLSKLMQQELVPLLQNFTQEIRSQIPDVDARVEAALIRLQGEAVQRLQQQTNGHLQTTEGIPISSGVAVIPKPDLVQTIMGVAAALMPMLIPLLQTFQAMGLENKKFALQLKQFELMQTSPLVLARSIASADPLTAKVFGLYLGGEPLAARLPEIQAHTAIGTWDVATKTAITAFQKTLQQMGWSPPQGLPLPDTGMAPSAPLVPNIPSAPNLPSPSPSPNLPGKPGGNIPIVGLSHLRKDFGTVSQQPTRKPNLFEVRV